MIAEVVVIPTPCPAIEVPVTFEIPKSSTLTDNEPSARRMTNRLAGFRSRCTMPSPCASAMASHACSANSTACSMGSAPLATKPRSEITALQVLHDHVGRAVVQVPDVDDPCAVLALDLDRGARLLLEASHRSGVCQCVRQQELDRHPLVELQVVRGDDDAHAARTEHPVHAVLACEDIALLDSD